MSSLYCKVFVGTVLVAQPLIILSNKTHATGMEVGNVFPNFVGIGVGATPDFVGSSDNLVGAAPGARVSFDDNRYAEWYGTYAGIKLNTDSNWEYGPAVILKLGRYDVKNEAINLLDDIDAGLEAGGFISYSYISTDTAIPFRARVGMLATTAVAGGAEGSNVNVYANFWLPLSYTTFVGTGVGVTWGDDKFMQHNFGVSSIEAERSGIAEFDAQGGVRQVNYWLGAIHRLNDEWALGAGIYYQNLLNDAAHSSIVQQHGQRDQLTYGLGIGYLW